MIVDLVLRHHMAWADLTLLKEGAVYDRYSKFAACPKAFCDTMYSREVVINDHILDQRIGDLKTGRPIRAAYCGRLISRKGVDVSLKIIEHAKQKGALVEFDIIGSGPEEPVLKQLVDELCLKNQVRFLGFFPYGTELLRRLFNYDILLYTPVEEDTPRMVFDAYAAGLVVVGTAIPFLVHRTNPDGASLTFP